MSTTSAGPVPATVTSPDPRRWRALALLCVAFFMIIVDSQIVILALPSIEHDLAFPVGTVQWVMSAYLLSFGGLLLLGGRMADLLGGRRMFMLGTLLFLVASVLCGFAWDAPVLIVARVVQGIAAALMAPTAMAVLMTTFPEGPERSRALGVWTGVGAFGATAALLIGGPITDGLGWPWIFFINIPLAALVLIAGPRLLRETPKRPGVRSFDPVGAITITLSLAVAVYAIAEAPVVGWGSAQTLGLLAASAVLLAVFVVVERGSRNPLVPLRIFRSGTLVGGNLIVLATAMAVYGGALTMSVYGQQVLGYSAVMFGLSTAIYAAMSVVGSNVAGKLSGTIGWRPLAIGGAVLLTAGALLLTRVTADGNYWTEFLPGLVVFGYGIGTTHVAGSIAALSGTAEHESGLASGINSSVFQIGAALGIAICSTVTLAVTSSSALSERGALTAGVQAAFLAAAVFAAVAIVVAVVLAAVRRTAKAR